MNEIQFRDPNPPEPIGRKPDGRSLLNRLSPDRQAAVADYAATHTPPKPSSGSNPGWHLRVKWACERKSAEKCGKVWKIPEKK